VRQKEKACEQRAENAAENVDGVADAGAVRVAEGLTVNELRGYESEKAAKGSDSAGHAQPPRKK
jgi:hypothetical protein